MSRLPSLKAAIIYIIRNLLITFKIHVRFLKSVTFDEILKIYFASAKHSIGKIPYLHTVLFFIF